MSSWLRRTLVVLVAITLPFILSDSALAASKQSKAQINSKINTLQDQADEVSADEADLMKRMDDINSRKADLDSQVSGLNGQIADAQAQISTAQARLASIRAQVDQAQAQLKTAQDALAASTRVLQERAVDAYVGTDQTVSLADVVLRADDIRELAAAGEYMNQVVVDRRAVVEQHRELEGQAKDLAKKVEQQQAEANAELDAINKHQSDLAGQKSQLDAVNSQVKQQADAQQALVNEAEGKRAAVQAQIDALQAQSDSIGATLRAADPGGTSSPSAPVRKGKVANPVPGAPMTSPFGTRFDPVYRVTRLHAGQDFGVSIGTSIHAALDGNVVSAGVVSGYGNYTCISHGGGMSTCYAHQSQIMVHVGQHVTQGQIIGKSGNTGASTGPHLHFEVRINGTPVDPRGYL